MYHRNLQKLKFSKKLIVHLPNLETFTKMYLWGLNFRIALEYLVCIGFIL